MSDEGIGADEVFRRLYDAVVADEQLRNPRARRDEPRPTAAQLELDPATVAAFRELPLTSWFQRADFEQAVRLRTAFQLAVYRIHLYRSVEGGSVEARMQQLRQLRPDDALTHGVAASLAYSRFDALAKSLPKRMRTELEEVGDQVGPPRPGLAYAARAFAERVAPEVGSRRGNELLHRLNQEPPDRRSLLIAEALANADRKFGDLWGGPPDAEALAGLTTETDRLIRAGFHSIGSAVPAGPAVTETQRQIGTALGAQTAETAIQYAEDVRNEWATAALAKDFGHETEKPAAVRSAGMRTDVLAGQPPPTAAAPVSDSAALSGEAATRRGPGAHRQPERGH